MNATAQEKKIGYVGLGNMGGALAKRLKLTKPLFVYDRSSEAIQRLVACGATACESLTDLASKCDIIVLCLPTSEHVHSALFDAQGLVDGARSGTLIVDQTSGDPTLTRNMAIELARRGIEMIDAPVSGGPQGAQAGTIAIMVGASAEQYARILPVLQAISPNIFHAGGIGTGHVIKLANNLLSAGQRLMTMEAVALAVKNGLTPKAAVDIILASSGRNFYAEKFMGSHIITGKLASGFTLGLMHKDVRLACKLGDDSGVTMLFGGVTKGFYQMTMNEMGEEEQVNAVALMMDRLAGTDVVPADYSLK